MPSSGLTQVPHEAVATLSLDIMDKRCEDSSASCLEYQAPWLVERLCEHGVAATKQEARALFLELKRYLLLAQKQGERVVPMFSLRIDEVWHQFILFTAEYTAFCACHFDHYLHHLPEQSTPLAQSPQRNDLPLQPLSFEQFEQLYTQAFGALPALWSDAAAVDVTSRVIHAVQGLVCRETHDSVALVRAADEQVVCRVGRRAANAMNFIARTRLFLVRELPGLNDDERLKVVRPLVQYGALRLKY